jgi:hypothetical protein
VRPAIAAAAACSGDGCRPASLSRLRGLTASDVITHSADTAGPQPGMSGRKTPIHSPRRARRRSPLKSSAGWIGGTTAIGLAQCRRVAAQGAGQIRREHAGRLRRANCFAETLRVDRPHRADRPDADLRGATPTRRARPLCGAHCGTGSGPARCLFAHRMRPSTRAWARCGATGSRPRWSACPNLRASRSCSPRSVAAITSRSAEVGMGRYGG